MDLPLTFTTGGDGAWSGTYGTCYHGLSSATSGALDPNQSNWLQTTVTGPGTVSFQWKTQASDAACELDFSVDGTLRSSIGYTQSSWQQVSYTITGSGTHTLKWTFSRSATDSGAAYVDYVQWTGTMPLVAELATTAWKTLTYTYDASGRRIAKAYDGDTILKYIYDGDHCVAEYDAYGSLHRKYIYGPGIDQPVCMIEATPSYAGTYYYHFDALGSVVALTNSSGSTVEVYEYSVYGQVGASDATHPNRFTFTGREFDKETGLYYYRARYYNPQIGRFLQTDPVGYGDGMNWYRYCTNNPVSKMDPSGMIWKATGRVMVLPSMYSPTTRKDDPMPVPLIGVVVFIGDLLNDSQSVFGFISAWMFSIPNELTINWTWKSYIEVADYNDWNHDGVIDACDVLERTDIHLEDPDGDGDIDKDDVRPEDYAKIAQTPEWVEVVGVVDPHVTDSSKKQWPGFFIEGAGYTGFVTAFWGAVAAASYFPDAHALEKDGYMDPAVPVGPYGGKWVFITDWIKQHLLWIGGAATPK